MWKLCALSSLEEHREQLVKVANQIPVFKLVCPASSLIGHSISTTPGECDIAGCTEPIMGRVWTSVIP
jgi:hypothetical protein